MKIVMEKNPNLELVFGLELDVVAFCASDVCWEAVELFAGLDEVLWFIDVVVAGFIVVVGAAVGLIVVGVVAIGTVVGALVVWFILMHISGVNKIK